MKNILLTISLILLPLLAFSAEIMVPLDQVSIINPPIERSGDSKIALQFSLPKVISDREIAYAELSLSIQASPVGTDSLLELQVFSMNSAWNPENLSYENCGRITDTVLVGASLIKLGEKSEFRIDVTPYLEEINAGEKTNFGLVAITDLLGDSQIRLSDNGNELIRSKGIVKIIYK
jgi:hypothetical protein